MERPASPFVDARVALVRWWLANKTLLLFVDDHFPKTHPLRRSMWRLCDDFSLCCFRRHAELMACRRDIGPDVVQDIRLESPLEWFSSMKLPQLVRSIDTAHWKSIDVMHYSLVCDLGRLARSFMNAVWELPQGSSTRTKDRIDYMRRCEVGYWKAYGKVTRLLAGAIDRQQVRDILLCLRGVGLPGPIAAMTVSFVLG